MMDLDDIDRALLRELLLDGRLPNKQLAERVGLSPSACLRRVQDLARHGVIRGYRAVLDPEAMGQGFVAYVTVGLAEHSRAAQQRFERAVTGMDEVRECHSITGAAQYLLRVETGNLAEFRAFQADRLGAVEGVRLVNAHVVMGSPKDERA